jgi:hypothetical protein
LCGAEWLGSKYLVPGTHDFRCGKCRKESDAREEAERWAGKSEPDDFVTCKACGYRAENLTSHLQSVHEELLGGEYQRKYPGSLINALHSGVRDKTLVRGAKRPEGFGAKVSSGKRKTRFKHTPEARAKMSASQKEVGRRIFLEREQLLPFQLKNGKVSIARASVGLDLYTNVIRRECVRLGLPYHRLSVNQDRFLGLVSKLLGAPFLPEWTSPEFVNPKTNRKFKFDGFFPEEKLLAEFHGYQHYTFPNRFHKSEEAAFEEMRERDAEKKRQVAARGEYRYLEVRDDEAWFDESFLTEKLLSVGISFDSIALPR